MTKGIPIECQKFLKLQHINQTDIISVKNIIDEREGKWKGPFAWSLLVMTSKVELNDTWGELSWVCCKVIHAVETQLTIQRFDFEKMLCNLSTKFLEAKLGNWACALCSLLFERLKLKFNQNDEFNEKTSLTKQICLGTEFMRKSPRLLVTADAHLLLFNCQLIWLRLFGLQKIELQDLELIRDLTFEAGGIVETASIIGNGKTLETLLKGWRILVVTIISKSSTGDQDSLIFKIESDLFQKLAHRFVDDGEFRSILDTLRYKNFCSYAAVVCPSRNFLEHFQELNFCEFKMINEIVARLEVIPKDHLMSIYEHWPGNQADRILFGTLMTSKGEELTDFLIPDRFSCCFAFEVWLTHHIGRYLGTIHDSMTIIYLRIVNSFAIIRTEAMLKVYDGLLRRMALIAKELEEINMIMIASKRMFKLAIHFDKATGTVNSICMIAKSLAVKGDYKASLQLLNLLNTELNGKEKGQNSLEDAVSALSIREDLGVIIAEAYCSIINKFPDDNSVTLLVKIAADSLGQNVAIANHIILMLPRKINPHYQARVLEMMLFNNVQNLDIQLKCLHVAISCNGFVQWNGSLLKYLEAIESKDMLSFCCLSLLWEYMGKKNSISSVLDQLASCLQRDKRDSKLIVELLDSTTSLLKLLGEYNLAISLISSQEHINRSRPLFDLHIAKGDYDRAKAIASRDKVQNRILTIEQTDGESLPLETGQRGDDDDDNLPTIYRSKAFYINGNLTKAFTIARRYFDTLLSDLKSKVGLDDLWNCYSELMELVNWLCYLMRVIGCYRLAKYFAKAGMTYSDSIRSRKWKQRISKWYSIIANEIENDEGKAEKMDFLNHGLECMVDRLEARIQKLINTTTLSLNKMTIEGLKIFKSTRDGKVSDQNFSLIKLVARCGTTEQLRRLVYIKLMELNEPSQMVKLIKLVIHRELLNPTKNNDDDDNVDSTFNFDASSPEFLLFSDHSNNFFYFFTSSVSFMDGPVVLRIKLDPLLDVVQNDLLTLLDDNKKMLFSSTIPITNDNNDKEDDNGDKEKRTWWMNRYKLEMRLKSIIETMNGWIESIQILLPNTPCQEDTVSKKLHRKVQIPDGIKLDHLLGCLINLKSKDLQVNILKCLGFTEDTFLTILKLVERTANYRDCRVDDPFLDIDKESAKELTTTDDSLASKLVLMTIDPILHNFPWEACEALKNYLLVRTFNVKENDPSNLLAIQTISALLNPSGDLKRTEETIFPTLQSISTNPCIVGRAPSRPEVVGALSRDLFLYFGHGSGELYLSAHEIALLDQCGCAFLFGCSSGRLRKFDNFNAEGALLAFKDAASPLILTNLWDVTDKDIDKLTRSFLLNLNLDTLPSSLELFKVLESLRISRETCIMKLLNGAAPTIYYNKMTN